jgi:hypothetical protein
MRHRGSVTAERIPPIPTTKAAAALGIPRTKLYRWWTHGLVEPSLVTIGGHARWDLEDLKRQIGEFQEGTPETARGRGLVKGPADENGENGF